MGAHVNYEPHTDYQTQAKLSALSLRPHTPRMGIRGAGRFPESFRALPKVPCFFSVNQRPNFYCKGSDSKYLELGGPKHF